MTLNFFRKHHQSTAQSSDKQSDFLRCFYVTILCLALTKSTGKQAMEISQEKTYMKLNFFRNHYQNKAEISDRENDFLRYFYVTILSLALTKSTGNQAMETSHELFSDL